MGTCVSIRFLKDYKESTKGNFYQLFQKDQVVHLYHKKALNLIRSNVATWA